ncbi:unnamed protein product [Phytophthora fragariaefolia]|uniref:Unnamed protein product n=1 Tax=Phytophthora fragariaefolia TaxID=1490495 RepID=A0A9W7DA84_9STRA|nr:unnamed protein product [Phytophthora fragariaefolia]
MESTPRDDDVDMLRHLEIGFKRNEPSYLDANSFEVLEDMDCNFETFQPEMPDDVSSGVLTIPRLVRTNPSPCTQEPLLSKRRTTYLNQYSTTSFNLDGDFIVLTEATCLESHEDPLTQNVRHLSHVKSLLHEFKNMDQVIESIRTFACYMVDRVLLRSRFPTQSREEAS